MFVRSKICGITNLQDAQNATDLGANALGFVFYPPSKRYISHEQASYISKHIPPFISLVGLFVNPEVNAVHQILQQVHLDILQFHGDENPAFCESFAIPYIKAIRVTSTQQILNACEEYKSAKALLLDTFVANQFGGTGTSFNWDLIPNNLNKPIILAGGLNTDNLTSALQKIRPFAVDVSGGVEKSAGIKDKSKLQHFLATIAHFNSSTMR